MSVNIKRIKYVRFLIVNALKIELTALLGLEWEA